MTRAEELAEQNSWSLYGRNQLIKVLIIYGNEVKEAAARECERIGNKIEDERPNKYLGDSALDCAQAIRNLKLP